MKRLRPRLDPNALSVRGDRDEEQVVLAAAEDGALLAQQSDDAHRMAGDVDRAAERIELAEQLVLHVGADDGHHRRVLVFGVREEAPLFDVDVVDLADVGGAALHAHAAEFLRAVLDRELRVLLRADGGAARAVLADGFEIVPVDLLALDRFEELLAAGDDPELRDDVDVGIEREDFLRDVADSARR